MQTIIKHISHYSVVFRFEDGYETVQDVMLRLSEDGITEDNLCQIRGEDGGTLLHEAISSQRIELIEYFISKDIPINVVTKDGYNELHLLAECVLYSNNQIDKKEQYCQIIQFAHILLDRGIDLTQQDKKYKNTPVYSLLYAGALNFEEGIPLIKRCIDIVRDVHIKNRAGHDLIDWLTSCEDRGQEIIDYCKSLGLLTESPLEPSPRDTQDSASETSEASASPRETAASPSAEENARYEKYRNRKLAEGKDPMRAEAWLKRYGASARKAEK